MTLSRNILVAYATTHGASADIASFMAERLRERPLTATVAAVEAVASLDGYDACILGTPIYGGMWLTQMSQFLDRFGESLARRPVYFWISCIRILEEGGREHALKSYLHWPTLERIGVRADIGVFAGRLDFEAIDWEERWTLAARYDGREMPGSHSGDYRDWTAIRAWINQVRDELTGI